MANLPDSISHIQLNDGLDPHPIDAATINGKTSSNIGELVTSINSSSTDVQYPSAKCIYEMIYGGSGVVNHNWGNDTDSWGNDNDNWLE